MTFHQTHSAPVMEDLRQWMETQFAEHKTEPNSGLGKAISYLLRHWTKLTLFLRQQVAPLDKNVVERALKKAILHRNWVKMQIRSACRVDGLRIGLLSAAEGNLRSKHPYINFRDFPGTEVSHPWL